MPRNTAAQSRPGRSTGPRTPAGKARSSQNARKHGLSLPMSRRPELAAAAAKLARHIGGKAPPPVVVDFAEAVVQLEAVRRARASLRARIGTPSTAQLLQFDDYERRACTRRRKALDAMEGRLATRAEGVSGERTSLRPLAPFTFGGRAIRPIRVSLAPRIRPIRPLRPLRTVIRPLRGLFARPYWKTNSLKASHFSRHPRAERSAAQRGPGDPASPPSKRGPSGCAARSRPLDPRVDRSAPLHSPPHDAGRGGVKFGEGTPTSQTPAHSRASEDPGERATRAPPEPPAGAASLTPPRPLVSLAEVEGAWDIVSFDGYSPSRRDGDGRRQAYVDITPGGLRFAIGCKPSGMPGGVERGVLVPGPGDDGLQTAMACEGREAALFRFLRSRPQVVQLPGGRLRLAGADHELVLERSEARRLA